MLPVIQPEELVSLIGRPGFILVDARSGEEIMASYLGSHLRGAQLIDLGTHLSEIGPDASKGGRHPLPDIHKFAEFLGKMGISPGSHVVVYDDKSGANFAARFWWMLRSAGHARVQVLNGGIAPAIAAGVPVSSGPEQAVEKNPYPVSGWQLGLAGILEVEQAISDPGRLVIDVRDACRYNGESEPIDLVAGHIPGAVNIPLTTNLEADGFFKSPAELNQNYTRALNGRDPRAVIVHCGSGVTACHTLLAMAYAGMEIPCLYVGSWSEWSRTGRPVGRS